MTGTAAEIPYADFGMKYEKTADVYAVQFDVTTDQEANQVLVGAGTTMLERLDFLTTGSSLMTCLRMKV